VIWLLAVLMMFTGACRAQDVVSLNVCSDQLLVLLAPERVAALSSLARDPALSFVSETAAHMPIVRADAEAVLRLHPALVLAGSFGAQTTLSALEQRGILVVRLDMPQNFDEIAAQIIEVARLLGVPGRGDALVRQMRDDLVPVPEQGRRALLWGARGWSSGPRSLGDAVLHAAGLANASAGGQIGLEALLAHPPDLIVTGTLPATPSLATDMLRHPALASVPRRELPPSWLLCGGPFTAHAARLLAP